MQLNRLDNHPPFFNPTILQFRLNTAFECTAVIGLGILGLASYGMDQADLRTKIFLMIFGSSLTGAGIIGKAVSDLSFRLFNIQHGLTEEQRLLNLNSV